MKLKTGQGDKRGRRVWVTDTTLRDGEQAPGVAFTRSEKVQIASLLAETGIDEIEAGIPGMGTDAQEDIRQLSAAISGVRLTSWCRAVEADIRAAETCNTGSVHISFPGSSILLNAFHKNREWVCRRMEMLIPRARKTFPYVSVGVQDATRCGRSWLKELAGLAGECGADRFRIADTVGRATPTMIQELMSDILATRPGLELDFHGHNDLGMATANTICAVEAGAHAVNVTVNGLGERAGNACLEEIAAALPAIAPTTSSFDFEKIQSLCRLVSNLTGRPIPVNKPVTGADVCTHESGTHCRALLQDPLSYQPVLPETWGRPPFQIKIGASSGLAALRSVLEQHGMAADWTKADQVMPTVRRAALAQRRCLTVADLKTIFRHPPG